MTSEALQFNAPTDEPTVEFDQFFSAPPSLVFQMFTEAEHLVYWWGPSVFELVTCEIDLRVGGAYRYVLRSPDGQRFSMDGVYQEVDAPHRLVSTFVLDTAPQNEVVESLSFEAVDTGTWLVGVNRHQSLEARDHQAAGGLMEAGLADQYLRLAALLEPTARTAHVNTGAP
jgi:uncharacterized protein YndB with AHSA1/START domain